MEWIPCNNIPNLFQRSNLDDCRDAVFTGDTTALRYRMHMASPLVTVGVVSYDIYDYESVDTFCLSVEDFELLRVEVEYMAELAVPLPNFFPDQKLAWQTNGF